LFAAIRLVTGAFEKLGIEYFLCGSVVSGILGEPRQTIDADIVTAILGRHAEPLTAELRGAFYVDLPSIFNAIERQASFNVIHLDTMVKVDIYISWRSEFARSEFARRLRRNISRQEPLEVNIASPEDTVLAKLDWYRKGGGVSDRQWRDLLGVLKVQGDALDCGYLTEWARKLELTDLLQRALEDAGRPPLS
jgi:hypothetical protein